MHHEYYQSARERQIEESVIAAAKAIARAMNDREAAADLLRRAGCFEAEIRETLQ